MQKLAEIPQKEDILFKEDLAEMIQPVASLPAASADEVGKAYVLTAITDALPGRVYTCVENSGVYSWKELEYKETGRLGSFTHVWAKSVVGDNMATVYIHWTEPEDINDLSDMTKSAVWHHTVIVRKKGNSPANINDGEIVGYSSVRNQYSGKTGFIDSVPADELSSYHYHLYAVTRFGMTSGEGSAVDPILSWARFRELVRGGYASHVVEVGDILPVKHKTYGVIDFKVAAIDNAVPTDFSLVNSVTLIADKVLLRAPFDYAEVLYAKSKRTSVPEDGSVKFYVLNTDTGVFTEVLNPIGSPLENGWYEKNDLTSEEIVNGRNDWELSDARNWLNSETAAYSDDATGFEEKPRTREGFLYGFKALVGGDEDFLNVLAQVNVVTTDYKDPTKTKTTADRVFLPSYTELLGEVPTKSTYGSNPNITVQEEGFQFDVYKVEGGVHHQKLILGGDEGKTTKNEDPMYTDSTFTNLASWYTRTPDTSKKFLVFAVNNQGLIESILDTDRGKNAGCVSRICDQTDSELAGENSLRIHNCNMFRYPEGTGPWYQANLAPGFAPCVVIA